jgi:hypothetical protein
MPSTLDGLIHSALTKTWGPVSQSELTGQLELAENAVREYARSLAQTSTGDPAAIQDSIATFRASKYSEAITNHITERIAVEAAEISDAILAYLRQHSTAQYVPGSLVATPSGVVAPSPAGLPVSSIQYT